jgi:hypothetical protein
LAASADDAAAIAERVAGDFHSVQVASSPAGGPEIGSC